MINLTRVPVGALIRLKDGEVREVTDNPGDGMWLFACPVGDADSAELYHADQIADLADEVQAGNR